ncbi:uncharacterized protein B0H18DRAFT_126529 [Fomitopsis serialis]|uniref:uncharacterized protein n=1 Tax=Fomitopsis serialis TaxID=139415 RepID=UPI0020087719|nr:uncharacterized protein B0H18DRAFT_126529 [Neoantrodia serialis]KAH9914476.1 hypothetical protein B0H18DRAFT_126529 [Neoantrodia serialis]
MSHCHRALQHNDVLHEVFTWLTPPLLRGDLSPEEEEIRHNARHDLTNIARVCKAFSEHALDALWRELDDLLPVMQLLTESHDFDGDGTAVGGLAGGQDVSLISENEWMRFRHYARRVRVIRSSGFGTFEASMLLHLARRNADKALFPRLRCLTHTVRSNLDTGLLSLVTPTLEEAKLEFCGETWYGLDTEESPAIARKLRDYAVQFCLSTVCSNAPELQQLTITGLGRISSLSPLVACNRLRRLHVHDVVLSPRSLRTLVSLDSLHELDMSFERTNCDPSGAGLASLQRLSLSGPMCQMPTILDTVSSTHVRAVRISDASNKATYQECTECIQAISKFPLLDSFHLAADNVSVDDDVPTSVPLTGLLAPLLPQRRLRTLSVSRWQPGGFILGDDDVETLASAWPDIVSLALAVNRADVVPTLHSLVVLARACPALRALELPSITIASAEQLRLPVVPHRLRTFEVGDPDRRMEDFDAAEVAQWLFALFPRISMPGESEDYPEFLARLLGELQRLRREAPPSTDSARGLRQGREALLPLSRASDAVAWTRDRTLAISVHLCFCPGWTECNRGRRRLSALSACLWVRGRVPVLCLSFCGGCAAQIMFLPGPGRAHWATDTRKVAGARDAAEKRFNLRGVSSDVWTA